MVIDIFTFNGEYDLLEIRLNILDEFVDQFIICEAPTTFSGKPKSLYYKLQEDRYKKWHNKIKYFVIDENYTKEEIVLAESSPNTRGASHWKHEFLQKESIKKALVHLKDDDVCFVGDVDEIWSPDCLKIYWGVPIIKLMLRVYTYYLNNLSSELFWGTIMTEYKNIKDSCLNHLRSGEGCDRTEILCGWHFTSQGGVEEVKRKLDDSYTEESYNTKEVQIRLEERFQNNQDYMGRNFIFRIDESSWPIWLKENKQKYAHLCAKCSKI